MGSIFDLKETWRSALVPAYFDNRLFHVDHATRMSGRRVVTHQFPKKDTPYSEDMGRVATAFDVKGYCISYMRDTGVPLWMRDYRIARNLLIERLDQRGSGVLQLPTLPPVIVVCSGYRWSEDQKAGGYCEFDMSFVEWGVPPFRELPDTGTALLENAKSLRNQIQVMLSTALTQDKYFNWRPPT